MIVAWTGDPEACEQTARRLGLVPEEVVQADAAPPGWWWLTPPAGLLATIGRLRAGDHLLLTHHPLCGAPLVVATVEFATTARGASLSIFPRLPRYRLEAVRLAVRLARPEDWHQVALALRRSGRSITAIAAELRRMARAGELRDAPSRATVGRLLKGR